MAERLTIAVKDPDETLKWFSVADARRWQGATSEAGELFQVAGRWVHLAQLSVTFGLPADLVDDAGPRMADDERFRAAGRTGGPGGAKKAALGGFAHKSRFDQKIGRLSRKSGIR